MQEKPVPFMGFQVRAILQGKKTRFSFPITPSPVNDSDFPECPFGKRQDRLFVQEKWAVAKVVENWESGGDTMYSEWGEGDPRRYLKGDARFGTCAQIFWEADKDNPTEFYDWKFKDRVEPAEIKFQSAATMPQWASRIVLENVWISTSRLLDMREDDAKAEGFLNLGAFFSFWEGVYGKTSFRLVKNPWIFTVNFIVYATRNPNK